MRKQLFALMLALALVFSAVISVPSAQAATAAANTFYGRIADPSTMNSWADLFGPDVGSTANVGTVWTDKTVTTETPSGYNFPMESDGTNFMVTLSTLSATMSITGHETLPTDTVFVLDLSSSMYRVGGNNYNTIYVSPMVDAVNTAIDRLLKLNPLNRVGVVIYYGHKDCWPESDQSHYVRLLQLDTYTPLQSADYLSMILEGDSLRGISVNDNLTIRGTATQAAHTDYIMPGKLVSGTYYGNVAGTYMQLGIKKALEMMLAADATIPPDSEFQAGATRIPIMVLMSDGEPTAADHEFAVVDGASMGANSTKERSPAGSDFLTQLTAGLARELLDRHYAETRPLFYTLGLGGQLSYDVMDPYATDLKYASSNADPDDYTHLTRRAGTATGDDSNYTNPPEVVNAKIQEYWDDLVNDGRVIIEHCYYNGRFGTDYTSSKTVSPIDTYTTDTGETISINYPTNINQKYYVDKYFPADTADDLAAAFKSLVDEIILQSEYYPTYVKNGAIGMSGYVDFHDEIGDMMEVKAVHGLARKATSRELYNIEALPDAEKAKIKIQNGIIYYKGEQIAEYFQDNMYSSSQSDEDKSEITRVLTSLFQKRLGLNETDAQALLAAIVQNRAIYYTEKDDGTFDYSNAFTWYATADESFIALDVGQEKPANAAYKITSCWYASPYDLENTNSFIRVKMNLTTGMHKQCVTWSVPASMIPLVKYQITLTGDKLDENDAGITVAYKDNFPMRAFFEVGLRSDVTKYDAVEEAIELLQNVNYGADNSILFDQANGVYHFFSNTWDQSNTTVNLGSIDSADNTVSYFTPSEQNERYYVTTTSPLYHSDGTPWTSEPSSNSKDVYVKAPVFHLRSGKNWYTSTESLENAASNSTLNMTLVPVTGDFTAKEHSGNYYIDSQTLRYPDTLSTKKESNPTNSLDRSVIEAMDKVWNKQENKDNIYSVSILGNNGAFHFTADTGMAITKHISNPDNVAIDTDSPQEFTFVIAPAANSDITLNGNYAVSYHKNGEPISGKPTHVTAESNTLTVTLCPGETAYLAGCVIKNGDLPGLPAGSYTVTEQAASVSGQYFYEVIDVTVTQPGETAVKSSGFTATVPVAPFEITTVDYTNKPVKDGSITISKAVTADQGVTVPDADFTFEVTLDRIHAGKTFSVIHSGSSSATTVTAGADGKFTVQLQAGQSVTIHGIAAETPMDVTVKEITPPAGFTVTSDNPQMKTVTAGNTAAFPFENRFTPVDVMLSGTKTLANRTLREGEFTFALYSTGADYAIATDAEPIQTVQNGMDGAFAFNLSYNTVGTHYYVVKEVPDTATGMTYDSKVYHVTVHVTADETTNALKADVTGILEGGLSFANTYNPANATVTLAGKKTISGRPLVEQEFTFALYSTGSDYIIADGMSPIQTALNGTDGAFSFNLSYDLTQVKTHHYVVKEAAVDPDTGVTIDTAEYQVQVTVAYNQDTGTITATPAVTKVIPADEATAVGANSSTTASSNTLDFHNNYAPAATSIAIAGTKELTGRALENGEFTFELYSTGADYAIAADAEPLQTTQNNANGAFAFTGIACNMPGTHYFVVKEAAGTLPGVDYDSTVYRVQVDVTDDKQGKLVSSYTYTKVIGETTEEAQAITFINRYDAVDSGITISGTKTLIGRTLREGEFTFELIQTESDFATPVDNTTAQQVTNDANGAFIFPQLSHPAVGTYYYVVKELIPEHPLPGMSYDSSEYHITVEVNDDPNTGKLIPTDPPTIVKVDPSKPVLMTATNTDPVILAVDKLSFENTFTPAEVILTGKKTLEGRTLEDGEFTFELVKMTDGTYATQDTTFAPLTVTNAADGSFSFPALTYTDQEMGKHYYVIREKDADIPGMIYDGAQHHIEVDVTVDTDNKMAAAVTGIPEGGLVFRNIYDATDTTFTFSGTKTLTGRDLAAGEFSFTLYEATVDQEGNFTLGDKLETVANAASGAFAFGTLADIGTAGTYHYIVREDAGTLPGVTYDTKEYRITVTVEDIGGVLEPTATVTEFPPKEETAGLFAVRPQPIPLTVQTLDFTNHYDAADTSVTFSGKKTLSGRSMNAGEFHFTLYTADQDYNLIAPVETVQNAADGSFAFAPIPLSAAGVYRYAVLEEQGRLSAMTYDDRVYRIEVVVTDVNAVLQAAVTVTTEGLAPGTVLAPDVLTFHNHHDPSDTAVVFSGTKTYLGHSLSHGDFTFTLYSADAQFNPIAPLETVTNAADGSFAFRPIWYSQPGTRHYVVREDQGGKPYIAYDGAEYRITVQVWNNNGALAAGVSAQRVSGDEIVPVSTVNGGLAFTNQYSAASVTVAFPGQKTYQGAELAEGLFTFRLHSADESFQPVGAPLETVTNRVDGSFSFSPRAFRSAGVYRFIVTEDVSAPLPNVAYDATVYHVTVTVTDDGTGSLTAATQVTTSKGLAAEMPLFENAYINVPDTGDHSEPGLLLGLCLASLTALAALMLISRRRVHS